MSHAITANEIKTRGVNAIEDAMGEAGEATITVHGKEKYVVLTLSQYHYLRECELEAALLETRKDLKEGRFQTESVDEHLKRIRHA